jgi:hypothetical protein
VPPAGRVGLDDGTVVGGTEDHGIDTIDVAVEFEEVFPLAAGRPQLGDIVVGEGVQGGAIVLQRICTFQQAVVVGGDLDTEGDALQ